MLTKNIIQHMEDNLQGFTFKIFNNIETNEKEIINTIRNSTKLSLLKSFDGLISHVKQIDENIYVGSTDRSRNSTDFNIHTDGLYYKSVPEILGLYCIHPGTKKNKSYITDTEKAIKTLLSSEIDILKQLQYTYIGRDGKQHIRDLIETDPLTGETITNISAKGFVSPFSHLGVNMPDLFESNKIVNKLYEALQDAIIYTHTWEQGDLLLINNNKYSHGRIGNEKDYERHLLRIRFEVDKSRL